MHGVRWSAAVALVTCVALATPAQAQTRPTIKVTRHAVVMDRPRGDSIVLGSVDAGAVLEVLGQQGNWYLVMAPAGASWPRGWIHARSLEPPRTTTTAANAKPKAARGRTMIRGFGQADSTLFKARDSFDTILGNTFGTAYGFGGQFVFAKGMYIEGSFEQFRKTGSRVLVSGNQIFTLQIPDTITLTPILGTVGYRDTTPRAVVPYFGVGLGWHTLREESSSLTADQQVDSGHIGYHVVGGVEFPVWSWLSAAGEIQWTSVPKALGDTGVSAIFKEEDLGGVAFRFKLFLGYQSKRPRP